jgi:tRNA A37 threonylcarbamoyladenosine dehydratase
MDNQFKRTEMLIGENALNKLKNCRVAVFGIGGVGGICAEALVRSGIGTLDIVDNDIVDITNLNRQIIATHKTVGKNKVDVFEERAKEINPEVIINKHNFFFSKDTSSLFDFRNYDYVIDAIDSVSSKLELVLKSQEANTPIISSMGTGNKLNAADLEVTDIYKTSVCPLARVMRYELKKLGVKKLKVVYSKEEPIKSAVDENGKSVPASSSFVPSAAGLIIAGEVIKDLIKG